MYWRRKNLGLIDPLDLESEDSLTIRVLKRFLMTNKRKGKFERGASYEVDLKGVRYRFRLTHDILHRKSASKPDQDRFEIFVSDDKNRSIGSVGTSFVTILGTLAPGLGSKLKFKKKDHKVRGVKTIDSNAKDRDRVVPFSAEINHEYELTKKVADINVKKPVNIKGRYNEQAYTVMRKLPGDDLFDIFENIKKKNADPFTIDERLNLTIKLLRKLQEYIHDKNIIHLDLKPHNIKYNRETGEVYIFDLGLSEAKESNKLLWGGTYSYAASEQFEGKPVAERTDVYAMGKVLSEIWDMPHVSLVDFIQKNRYEDLSKKDTQFNLKAFEAMSGIDDFVRSNIIATIKHMTMSAVNRRLALEDAIQRFETIRIQHRHAKLNMIKIDEIVAANGEGLHAWRKCRGLNNNHGKNANIEQLIKVIKSHLNKIPDNRECVQAFIQGLGVRAFTLLESKEAITNKIELVRNAFDHHLYHQQSKAILDFFSKDRFPNKSRLYKIVKSLCDEIKTIDEKINHSDLGIDEMVALNNKMTDFCSNKFKAIMNSYETDQRNLHLSDIFNQVLFSAMPNQDQNTDIAKFRQSIKQIIVGYIDSSYTKSSISKKDRAASARRMQDMTDILDIVNLDDNSDLSKLMKQVQDRTNQIKRGTSKTDNLFLRSFAKSELVDAIELVLHRYQDKMRHNRRNHRV